MACQAIGACCATHTGAVRIHPELHVQAWSCWIKQYCTVGWDTQANFSRHILQWAEPKALREHPALQQRLLSFINNFFKTWLGSCTTVWTDFHRKHIWETKIAVNYMELNTSLHIVTASLGLAIKLSGLG